METTFLKELVKDIKKFLCFSLYCSLYIIFVISLFLLCNKYFVVSICVMIISVICLCLYMWYSDIKYRVYIGKLYKE